MSGSIYQVGVHLHAKDGVSGVLANISHSLLGLHGGVEKLQKGFSSLQVGLLGAAAVAAGVKLGHVVEHLVEHGMELKHWQAQMAAAGATSKTVAEMTAAAWKLAGDNMNTTATDNMKNIIELNKVTANWHESAKLLPTFAKVETVLAAVKANGMHSGITGNSTQTLNFARGLEELGITTARKKIDGSLETEDEVKARIDRYTTGFIKSMQVSRGLFDGNQLYSSTNNSAGAAQNWDFDMATKIAPVIGEIMKAGKFGNADYMTLKSFQGGHITGDAAEALFKYHLVKADDLKRNEKGKIIGLNANTDFAKGMDSNLWDWSNRILEILKRSGMNTEDQKKVNEMINEIGSNKSNSGILRALLEPHEHAQIAKELGLMDKVPDNVASLLNQNDPFIKLQNLQKKWDDFLTAIGGPLVDPAIHALDVMTHTINDFAQYFAKNPAQAKMIGETLVGLSAGLTVLGAALIGGAIIGALGPAGWFIVAISTLGGALAKLHDGDWKDPEKFKPFGDSIDSFFKTFFTNIREGVAKDLKNVDDFFGTYFKNIRDGVSKDFAAMLAEVQSWPGRLAGAIKDFGSSLVAAIGAELKGLVSHLNPFSRTSYEGGGVGGGLINASYANDNDGSRLTRRAGGGQPAAFTPGVMPNVTGGASYHGHIDGAMNVGGATYRFGSGGVRGSSSVPFGDYPITPGAMGSWGVSHGALGINNNRIWDSALHRFREGILLHPGAGQSLITEGCVAFLKQQWPEVKSRILGMIREHGHAYLHVGKNGASITPYRTAVPPPPMRPRETVIHNNMHVDGKVMARSVTRHQEFAGMFPTAVGGIDAHGSFASPGTPLLDAA